MADGRFIRRIVIARDDEMNRYTLRQYCRLSRTAPRRRQLSMAVLFLVATMASFTSRGDEPRILPDLEYARAGDISLKLDLYVPANVKSPPVVLWVHGGAWRS